MAATATRTTVINLRADEPRRALIDRAAEAVGKNRSEFMLDAATREATAVLWIAASSNSMRARSSDSLRHSTLRHPIIRDFANCWRKTLPGSDDRGTSHRTRTPDRRTRPRRLPQREHRTQPLAQATSASE